MFIHRIFLCTYVSAWSVWSILVVFFIPPSLFNIFQCSLHASETLRLCSRANSTWRYNIFIRGPYVCARAKKSSSASIEISIFPPIYCTLLLHRAIHFCRYCSMLVDRMCLSTTTSIPIKCNSLVWLKLKRMQLQPESPYHISLHSPHHKSQPLRTMLPSGSIVRVCVQ